jgi:hypothetical protein
MVVSPVESEAVMTEKNLSQLLEQVRDELSAAGDVDEKGRELLRALDADIQKILESAEPDGSNDFSLERLRETIAHFEVTHPALTTALSSVMNALNNAGI